MNEFLIGKFYFAQGRNTRSSVAFSLYWTWENKSTYL
jgi:hypothetical protein